MRGLLAFILVLASTALAEAQTVSRIRIVEFGLFHRDIIETVPMPGAATGTLQISKNYRLIRQTDTIPAKIGTSFGVRFETIGKPKGRPVTLTWVTRFPAEGLLDPKNGKFHHNEFRREHTIGAQSFRTYGFDEPWEMVPGEWAFEFWDGPVKLGEQRFTVVKP